ncbi:hypothetical protein ACQP2F_18685 [Actinoplanes sp. CA-030573]|uniref:hypothetical protein n=1 Tax=Actinoplanes sp. CA-030573 TaxID=3239898 RepID=UPI003D948B65
MAAMLLLDLALALMLVVAGTALLGAHHLLLIAAGLVALAVALVVTHGHVVLRRRVPARAGTAVDVAPADRLAVAPMDGRTATAVALGATGLFLFNAVFGAIAIGLGLSALRRGAPGRWGRPGAVAGIVLGIADFLVLLIMLAVRLTGAGLQWS